MTMVEAVYMLSGLTSLACSVLLFRGWRRSGTRLLFWSGWCFAGLALNNILLFTDAVVVTDVNLALARSLSTLIGLALLVYGLVWENR
jgi:hypothetical protein